MITKIGKRLAGSLGTRKKALALLPVAALAAFKMPQNYEASMSYVDPLDQTYYREPGIFYDTLKRNPYVHA